MNALSIVIPAYNEENAIEETLAHIVSVMGDFELTYEIVVVNDGSKDATGEKLQTYKKAFDTQKHKNVTLTVVEHHFNKGYGAALKTGITHAANDAICITDADGTYPLERIPDLFDTFVNGQYDMVVGKRPFKKLPTITKPAKWFITTLASYLAERKIPDINSGLRIFKKNIAQKFFNIISNGFSFTTTITLAMMTNGYEVEYVPIDYHERKGTSKIHPIKDTLNFIVLIIRTVMYFNPLKVFVPLAFFLWFAAIAVLCIGLFSYQTIFDSSVAILVVGGVQVFATGMIADLIDKRN